MQMRAVLRVRVQSCLPFLFLELPITSLIPQRDFNTDFNIDLQLGREIASSSGCTLLIGAKESSAFLFASSDVAVVLKHPSRQMPGNCHGRLVRVSLFRKFGNALVAHIVKPKSFQSSRCSQRSPGAAL